MNETLSQSEIDEIIKSLAGGESQTLDIEVPHLAVKKYDFRRPNKFTKNQLRTLHMINENFSRIVSSFLSGYLRSSVNIKISSVEQTTYEEFLVSIPNPTLLTIFQMEPLEGSAVLELNQDFTYPAIDLLFGGVGKKTNKVRELTEIELRVLKKLNEKILENMVLAWSDVYHFNPAIEALEINPQYNQILSLNETVAIVTFSADIADNHSIINLCLPYGTLKEAIPNLTTQNWFAAHRDFDILQSKNIEERLGTVFLELNACCGETQLTIQEFLQLEKGDVVLLNKKMGEDMELRIGEHPKFTFQPGVLGDKNAAIITGKL